MFELVQKTITQYGVPDEHVYNFDETEEEKSTSKDFLLRIIEL